MSLNLTVSQVLEIAKNHEEITASRAIELFNQAHHYICGQAKLYQTTTQPILLVANQQEYALSGIAPTPLKIWQATFFSSQGAWTPVYPKNVDTLWYDMGPDWQLQSGGQPYYYYERGGYLGLVPYPTITSIGGYPNVTIEYDYIPTLSEQDAMPLVDNVYPWVYYICALAVLEDPKVNMRDLHRDQAGYMQLFQFHMEALRKSVYGRVARDHPRVETKIPRIRRA
jgi:hypothetical protein